MIILTNTYVFRGCDDDKNEDTLEHLTTNSFIVIITKILWTHFSHVKSIPLYMDCALMLLCDFCNNGISVMMMLMILTMMMMVVVVVVVTVMIWLQYWGPHGDLTLIFLQIEKIHRDV